jgi:hypothetical protein
MKCETGGLSVVHNRINRSGIDKIRRLQIKPLNRNPNPRGDDVEVWLYQTENVITHVFGVDFNSLYPTSFASMELPYFNIRNAVVMKVVSLLILVSIVNAGVDCSSTIMMPGSYVETLTDRGKIAEFMKKRDKVGFISAKGFVPWTEETLNFPPIIRNIDLPNSVEVIGTKTYESMQKNGVKKDKVERKLTQLLDTHGEHMVFYSYHLWFLIDRCGFVCEDIDIIRVFTAHDRFHEFAAQTRTRRQEAILNNDKVGDLFNKIALNGSYGYDIMNEANYSKVKIGEAKDCFRAQLKPTFKSSPRLAENTYLIEMKQKDFGSKTCVQEGCATLDIAKFLYLNFIYNFM